MSATDDKETVDGFKRPDRDTLDLIARLTRERNDAQALVAELHALVVKLRADVEALQLALNRSGSP